METTAILAGLGGGLGLFLFGLGLLTDTLKQLAGGGMKTLLQRMTRNRVLGALTGALVTAVIQSSSVTTVLVVGFISAGLLSLVQATGVIMGANVGSTVMAQIIAFDVTSWALPMIFCGFVLREFPKREAVKQGGTLLLGLGLIFLGMGAMSEATHPLRDYQPFLDALAAMDNPLLGILAGALFTALVQSSAATTGIAIAFAGQGLITLEAGIAIAFGANIGTCATAVLACIGKPAAAKQAAGVHLLFNVIGVAIWVGFLPQLADLVRAASPSATELSGAERLAADTPRQIANAHTIFNVINTLLFLPFTGGLAALVRKIIPDAPRPERIEPRFIDDGLLETPALAIEAVHRELGHVGQCVSDYLRAIDAAAETGDLAGLDRQAASAVEIEEVQRALDGYMAKIGHRSLSPAEADHLADYLSIADYLESAREVIHQGIAPGIRRYIRHPGPAAFTDQRPLTELAEDVLLHFREAVEAVEEWDVALAHRIIDEKTVMREATDASRAALRQLLLEGGAAATETYRLFARTSEHLQRLYYLSRRMAKRIVRSEERKAAA